MANLMCGSAKFKPARSAATPHVVGDRGLLRGKGTLLHRYACNCKAERNLSPHPLYNKAKTTLERLFLRKETQKLN